MGAELIATAIPKLTEDEYEAAIAAATPEILATAAFKADYREDFGTDIAFGAHAADRIGEQDPVIIDQIAGHAGAVEAIRTAARHGAQYLQKHMRWGGSFVVDVSKLGGLDVVVGGGSTFGDAPFEEFRGVAVLAAILVATGRC